MTIQVERPVQQERLQWGYRYVKVEPSHFRVEYQINPFMDLADQPDPARAHAQWDTLVATIERLGGRVDVIGQRADAPDMVYAMNLGLGVETADGRPHVVMSHMRYPQRRMETGSADAWFLAHGFTTSYVGRDGVGAHFEAGDAFAFGDALFVGYGPRTEELGLKHLAQDLDIRVRGFRITHPGMYHLDLAFCPLSSTQAIVCPAAFDDASAAALLAQVPEPLRDQRGGGAVDVLRQLDRDRLDRRDARLPRPGPRPAGGVGLRCRHRRRLGVPQGRRLDPLHDQPGRPAHRPRPGLRPRRRGRPPPTLTCRSDHHHRDVACASGPVGDRADPGGTLGSARCGPGHSGRARRRTTSAAATTVSASAAETPHAARR